MIRVSYILGFVLNNLGQLGIDSKFTCTLNLSYLPIKSPKK